VGEKTAAKLINQYGGIDGIYANLDEMTPKLRQNLAENEAQARMNAQLMKLRHDAPVTVSTDDLAIGDFDLDEVKSLFDFLEFRNLFDRLVEVLGAEHTGSTAPESAVIEAEITTLSDPAGVAALCTSLSGRAAPLAIAAGWSGVEGRSSVTGLALVTDASMGEVAWVPASTLADPAAATALASLFEGGASRVVAHDAKAIMRHLAPFDIDLRTLVLDTMIAAYLLDPAESRYAVEQLLERYADARLADGGTPEGQVDFGGDCSLRCPTRSCRAASPISMPTSRSPSSVCSPAWRSSASGSIVLSSSGSTPNSRRDVTNCARRSMPTRVRSST
jgi:DNA polymerase I